MTEHRFVGPLPTSWLADWSVWELRSHVDAYLREIDRQRVLLADEPPSGDRRRASKAGAKNLRKQAARYRDELRRRRAG